MDMSRFVRELIALRKRHASLHRARFFTGRPASGQTHPDVAWHGERLHEPAWHDPEARLLAFTLAGQASDEPLLHVVFNMDQVARLVALPALDKRGWRRVVDTAAVPPHDIVPLAEEARGESKACRVQARSVVVFEEG
jgi:glycogen operon protein